jgi:hypothetical protein
LKIFREIGERAQRKYLEARVQGRGNTTSQVMTGGRRQPCQIQIIAGRAQDITSTSMYLYVALYK